MTEFEKVIKKEINDCRVHDKWNTCNLLTEVLQKLVEDRHKIKKLEKAQKATTDKEKVANVFKEVGVEFELNDYKVGSMIMLEIEDIANDGIDLNFNKDGKYVNMD